MPSIAHTATTMNRRASAGCEWDVGMRRASSKERADDRRDSDARQNSLILQAKWRRARGVDDARGIDIRVDTRVRRRTKLCDDLVAMGSKRKAKYGVAPPERVRAAAPPARAIGRTPKGHPMAQA